VVAVAETVLPIERTIVALVLAVAVTGLPTDLTIDAVEVAVALNATGRASDPVIVAVLVTVALRSFPARLSMVAVLVAVAVTSLPTVFAIVALVVAVALICLPIWLAISAVVVAVAVKACGVVAPAAAACSEAITDCAIPSVAGAGLYVCAAEDVVIFHAGRTWMLAVADPPVVPPSGPAVQPLPPAVSESCVNPSEVGRLFPMNAKTRVAAVGGVIGPTVGFVAAFVVLFAEATSSVNEAPENSTVETAIFPWLPPPGRVTVIVSPATRAVVSSEPARHAIVFGFKLFPTSSAEYVLPLLSLTVIPPDSQVGE
jgi:hypothetical protein